MSMWNLFGYSSDTTAVGIIEGQIKSIDRGISEAEMHIKDYEARIADAREGIADLKRLRGELEAVLQRT